MPLPARWACSSWPAAPGSACSCSTRARATSAARWMLAGLAALRDLPARAGQAAAQALHDPRDGAPGRRARSSTASILVPVFGERARRRHRRHRGPAGGRARPTRARAGRCIEALYVFEIPMSLPHRRPRPRRAGRRGQAGARRAQGGRRGVRGRRGRDRHGARPVGGPGIVAEAKRRGVEAIVLAAEEPDPDARRGAARRPRAGRATASPGEITRYVVEKAPCRVILTAPPAGERGCRDGVAPY